jgi:SH3-like domain-containing protein
MTIKIFMTYNLKISLFVLLVILIGENTQAQNSSFKSLANEIQTIQKQLVPDKRTAILEISLSDTINRIIKVKGETNLPEAKSRILQLLSEKKILFTDSIRVLPDVSVGDRIWGLATLSVSTMRSAPDHASELVSQALMGTPLKVLDSLNGWYRVQTPDAYIGWMDKGGLTRFTDSEMESWRKSKRYVFNQIFGNAFESPNRKSASVTDLVMSDILKVEEEVRAYLKIRIPDGRVAYVRKSDCITFEEWTGKDLDIQTVIRFARQLVGVPYLWGGTSCKAVDCSGFTKTAYYSQGIILARDASQQVQFGLHPDFMDSKSLRPGDLLFFGQSAQRVTHVGLYLGDNRYINASGLVRYNSLDTKDPTYVLTGKKKLVGASRIMNSLNMNGIVLVKDHPWYSIIYK